MINDWSAFSLPGQMINDWNAFSLPGHMFNDWHWNVLRIDQGIKGQTTGSPLSTVLLNLSEDYYTQKKGPL